MRFGFYPRLACNGMRKNKQMYAPYLLTFVLMVMMQYIILFLCGSDVVRSLRGGATVCETMLLGDYVMAVFSGIFLFYTNSFLIRRRKMEFGLYNVLGMNKGNLAKLLFWENLIMLAVSLILGLLLGILFSKLAELILVNIIAGKVSFSFSISPKSLYQTAGIFGCITVLLYLRSLLQIRRTSAVNLMKSESLGEKPPRANWLLGVLGLLVLVVAYYLAVSIESPLAALMWFFVAVIMVIVATYLIMIAGSVMFCRILQKRKKYYYHPAHFVSVSSMLFRMKRNGAGLASVCILATMVLVTCSSTSSLYFGVESTLRNLYAREYNFNAYSYHGEAFQDSWREDLSGKMYAFLEENGMTAENVLDYRSYNLTGLYTEGGLLETDHEKVDAVTQTTLAGVVNVELVPLADFNRGMGTDYSLAPGQALLYRFRTGRDYPAVEFPGGNRIQVVGEVKEYLSRSGFTELICPTIVLIVPDWEVLTERISAVLNEENISMGCDWMFCFDISGAEEQQAAEKVTQLGEKLHEFLYSREDGPQNCGLSLSIRSEEREGFYALNGGLFFLGMLLSLVFILGAVLIIYYKQISEGFEDCDRFEIMQKVGMTKREIRRSINSQLLTVFFLPLVFAGLHLCFAFPFISKMLTLFGLHNIPLLVGVTLITYLVFGLCYTLVYKITSNAYYRIVSQ